MNAPECNASENLVILAHRKLVMGRRVRQLSRHIAELMPTGTLSVLDVGAGTGEMAIAINQLRPELSITGADIYIRPKTFIPVKQYDGNRLPFENGTFDAVMVVDVLHHCDDSVAVLRECARVSRRWILIKDHVSNNTWDRLRLRFMDWVGNRAHNVVLPYNYLSEVEWSRVFDLIGLVHEKQACRLKLYPQPLDMLFGGSLHCLRLLERK